MIEQLLHVIKVRQQQLGLSMLVGNPMNWDSYQRMVGEAQGLQYVLDAFDRMAEEEDKE